MTRRPARPRRRLTRLLGRSVGPALALGLLASPAAACPYCSLSQGTDTLVYVLAFLAIPYVIVYGTWRWMKHVLAQEQEAMGTGDGPRGDGRG